MTLPETFSTNLCWLLTRANSGLMAAMTEELHVLGISPRAQHVLSAASRGEFTQIELARMIGLDKTTMVVTLDELESAGLVERRPSPTDRRARLIAVTDAGRAKVRESEEICRRVQDEVLSVLDDDERAAFTGGLAKLTRERLWQPQ